MTTLQNDPERLFTINEAADYTRYGRRTIYKWINDGTLPACKVEGSTGFRIRRKHLDALFTPVRRAA